MEKRTEQSEVSPEQSDMVLIEQYLAGDQDAFTVLYERYKRQLYAYLNRLLQGRNASADDIFQQTWIRAVANLPGYRNKEMFLAWLMRIAHNLTIDLFRSADRRAEQSLSEVDPETETPLVRPENTPSGEAYRRELSEAIDRAVGSLPAELREVFLLRQENVPFREIAGIQGCSINTCLARMRYALNRLKVILKNWEPEDKVKK